MGGLFRCAANEFAGALDAAARLARVQGTGHGVQEFLRGKGFDREQGGSHRHGDSTGHALGVQVRHLCRQRGLLGGPHRVTGEERAERGHPHRGAVATGTRAAKGFRGHGGPRLALPDAAQGDHGARAVAPVGLAAFGELGGQRVLVHLPAIAQVCHQAAGHLGVVGPLPDRLGWDARDQVGHRAPRYEELGAETIACGQAVERAVHQVKSCGVYGFGAYRHRGGAVGVTARPLGPRGLSAAAPVGVLAVADDGSGAAVRGERGRRPGLLAGVASFPPVGHNRLGVVRLYRFKGHGHANSSVFRDALVR